MLKGGFAITSSIWTSVLVARERVAPTGSQSLVVDAVDGEVHLGHPPGALVELLTVDRDILGVAVMLIDEFLGLHGHAARSAAGVIDATVRRLEHLNENPNHALRGVELATSLSFGAGELLQEVLIDLAQQVTCPLVALAAELRAVEQVEQLAQAALVDVVPVEDPRQSARKRLVVGHHQVHRIVDELAHVLLRLPRGSRQALGVLRKVRPSCGRGHDEDAVALVLLRVVDQGLDLLLVVALGLQLTTDGLTALVVRIGDLLKEDQSEDDVLVLAGAQRATKLVGGLPESVLEFLQCRRRRRFLLLPWRHPQLTSFSISLAGIPLVVDRVSRVTAPAATPSIKAFFSSCAASSRRLTLS